MIITLCEQRQTTSGFDAILSFDGQGRYPITITPPFSAQEEQQLVWYFEHWIRFSLADITIADRIAQSIKRYGERLFIQVFKANPDVYCDYRQLRNQLEQAQIEIVSQNPEFQSLHWEALQDPDWPQPLAVDWVMVRQSIQSVEFRARIQPSPVINLLVVTARPHIEKERGDRPISRPLMEVIRHAKLRVKGELLRPGTYQALSEHLKEKDGFYHILHLDTPRALLSYEQLQRVIRGNGYSYQAHFGRKQTQPYDGVKSFVLFEGGQPGEADPVEASELAGLLTSRGIPVCILHTYQSKQVQMELLEATPADRTTGELIVDAERKIDADRETSLGSQLIAAGIPMVVAMSYSVTVSAAVVMLEKFYRQLLTAPSLVEASWLWRRELFDCKSRWVYFNQAVNLEDWLLPVVYCNQPVQPVQLNLCEFASPQAEEAYYASLHDQELLVAPPYRFVDRDLEVLQMETLLRSHNILLLQGLGGSGKTTLLKYLQTWWQTTHFARQVFYFGYDEKAWTLEHLLFELSKQVYGYFEHIQVQAMSVTAQIQKLAVTLRAEPYILMLDNLESLTSKALALQNPLTAEQRQAVQDFLGRLVGGKTKVVLGARSPEVWLENVVQGNVYSLVGLDPEPRSLLAEKILECHVQDPERIVKLRQDGDFRRLMAVLAGYPLAMQVVLANLERQSSREILHALQLAEGDSQTWTSKIVQCVEYSHGHLSEVAQQLLVCLAPFSGLIARLLLPQYVAQLQTLTPFQAYELEQLDAALQEAIDWGLLAPMADENPHLLRIQPMLSYFLKTRLNQMEEEIQAALWEGFKQHYQALAEFYNQLMDSKEVQEQKRGIAFCRLEYENLYCALQICLEQHTSISIFFCLDRYFELIDDSQSSLLLVQQVCRSLETYPLVFVAGEQGYEVVFALSRLGLGCLNTQEYQQATQAYRRALVIYDQLTQVEERQRSLWKAGSYYQLGIVVQEMGKYEQAGQYYQQALKLFITYGDRTNQARTHHNLGVVAQKMGEFKQAWYYFQQALKTYIASNDHLNQASTYHNLGVVAQEMGEYKQAWYYFQQALEIKVAYCDRNSQASTYYHLGQVAEAIADLESARTNYLQALRITAEFQNEADLRQITI